MRRNVVNGSVSTSLTMPKSCQVACVHNIPPDTYYRVQKGGARMLELLTFRNQTLLDLSGEKPTQARLEIREVPPINSHHVCSPRQPSRLKDLIKVLPWTSCSDFPLARPTDPILSSPGISYWATTRATYGPLDSCLSTHLRLNPELTLSLTECDTGTTLDFTSIVFEAKFFEI